jgi:DNA invertase Pin-like site-specific DNA recombinase
MIARELPGNVISRRAVVYVRQSTGMQVVENLESQRRQYELAGLARGYGFRDVLVIDDDLGVSASGAVERPGFRNLVGQICEGTVGAVFCLEASRLARNGRDWHHLLELCALVDARVVDADGIYDPKMPNDRLLLGLKGTMSEFELTVLRRRLLEAAQAKARRGELRMPVPVGYVWPRDTGLIVDPDRRVQEAIRIVFRLFDRHGSGRQVLMQMRKGWPGLPPAGRREAVDHAGLASAVLPKHHQRPAEPVLRGRLCVREVSRADHDRRWRCTETVWSRERERPVDRGS